MEVIKKGLYKHYKGNNYQVLYIGTHSESLEEMVVYRALYGEQGIWIRPATMWNEVLLVDEKLVKRFEYIGEKIDEE